MIYRSNTHHNSLVLQVDYLTPDLYVYYLIWTKCIHNLCVHSYIRIIDSFYEVDGSYRVYVQKILNVGGISNSLESGQFFNVACINLTALLMIGNLQYQKESSGRYSTPTSKGTRSLSSNNIFYVDRWGLKC